MLSNQGNDILQRQYYKYRERYLRNHAPGTNENDVEQAFLFTVLDGLDYKGYIDSTTHLSMEADIAKIV